MIGVSEILSNCSKIEVKVKGLANLDIHILGCSNQSVEQ